MTKEISIVSWCLFMSVHAPDIVNVRENCSILSPSLRRWQCCVIVMPLRSRGTAIQWGSPRHPRWPWFRRSAEEVCYYKVGTSLRYNFPQQLCIIYALSISTTKNYAVCTGLFTEIKLTAFLCTFWHTLMHLQVPDCCGCCLVSVPVSQTLSLQPNSPPISSTAWSRLSESLSLCIPPSLSLCVCLLIFFCHLFSSNVCQSSYLRACARYGARRPKRITYTRAFIASSAR